MLTVRYGEKEYKALVSSEDFEKCSQHKWRIIERVRSDGSVYIGYAMTTIKTSVISLHKFILGQIPDGKDVIDHINGDKLDNRRENLRFLTFGENSLSFQLINKILMTSLELENISKDSNQVLYHLKSSRSEIN